MISKHKSNPFCHTYMPTDRRTVLRRAGVQICVRDNRENYQRQRDVVGYDARVSDAERSKAREAMKRHHELKHAWFYHPPRNDFNCRCVLALLAH